MNKKDALEATAKRFTNLMDGKVLSNTGVRTIIAHYESLLVNRPVPVTAAHCDITNNFMEEAIKEYEQDEWENNFGDLSH